jgi:hypothetical protein
MTFVSYFINDGKWKWERMRNLSSYVCCNRFLLAIKERLVGRENNFWVMFYKQRSESHHCQFDSFSFSIFEENQSVGIWGFLRKHIQWIIISFCFRKINWDLWCTISSLFLLKPQIVLFQIVSIGYLLLCVTLIKLLLYLKSYFVWEVEIFLNWILIWSAEHWGTKMRIKNGSNY